MSLASNISLDAPLLEDQRIRNQFSILTDSWSLISHTTASWRSIYSIYQTQNTQSPPRAIHHQQHYSIWAAQQGEADGVVVLETETGSGYYEGRNEGVWGRAQGPRHKDLQQDSTEGVGFYSFYCPYCTIDELHPKFQRMWEWRLDKCANANKHRAWQTDSHLSPSYLPPAVDPQPCGDCCWPQTPTYPAPKPTLLYVEEKKQVSRQPGAASWLEWKLLSGWRSGLDWGIQMRCWKKNRVNER